MVFYDLLKMIQYYNKTMADGEKLTVSNTIRSEQMSFHIYKLTKDFIFKSNDMVKQVMSLCKANDTYTQVIIGYNVTINSGVTLTPPYRCKGLILCVNNNLVNNGNIFMTARGCIGAGQNIYLFENNLVPKDGAGGGAGKTITARSTGSNGANGSNGSNRSTGGGGAGGIRRGNGDGTTKSGSGAKGTSYSGGSGGGAAGSTSGNATAGNGVANGGAGGAGSANSGSTGSSYAPHNHGGGAGNPGGAGARYSTSQGSGTANSGASGTGGLLVIYSRNYINNSNIASNGSNGGSASGGYNCGGGASGGGSVNIFYTNNITNNSVLANGGTGGTGSYGKGGNGGNGTVTYTVVDIKEFPEYIKVRKNSDIYDDSIPFDIFDYESFSSILGE